MTAYFRDVNSFDEFKQRLNESNGLFSVIIQKGQKVFAAVDRIRMFPLFYNSGCISDQAVSAKSNEPIILDEEAREDFLQTAFVTGNRTLIKDVAQIQAAEAVCFTDAEIIKEFYASFSSSEINKSSYTELKNTLKRKLESAFEVIINQLKDKTIVVPLSAGYDSRLIAVMLNNAGFKKVVCFTYGRNNYPEIEISKRVAEKLDYEWHYIEYDDQLIIGFLKDEIFKEFYQFSANHVSMFYLQEFFAIKQLKTQNLIPEDAVFISGHSGDFIAGSHLDGNVNSNTYLKKVANEIFKRNFGLLPFSSKYKNKKTAEIFNSIKNSKSLPHTLYENWDLMERQAKFIVNSCNTYNFFGHQHFLPFWDTELLNFFRDLPYEFKLNKRLYDEVITSGIFQSHELNFADELQPSAFQLKKQKLKNKIKKLIPGKIHQKYRLKNDPLCYWEITREMIKDMSDNRLKVNHNYKELRSVFTQWYLTKIGK